METSSKLHEDATRWGCFGLIGRGRLPLFWAPSLGASILGSTCILGSTAGALAFPAKSRLFAR
jgi:hypothetical protein